MLPHCQHEAHFTSVAAVRERNAHGGPHCMRVPAPQKELHGTPGLSASPGIPSNVAEVGDTHEPSLENCQDGDPMSTSESDQRYGDADGEFRENNANMPLVIDDSGSDGGGCGVSAAAQEPIAKRRDAGGTEGGLVVTPFATSTPARPCAGIRMHSHGDLDSERYDMTDVD